MPFLQGPDSDAAATSGGGTSETISAVRPFERPPCNGAQSLIIEGVTENPEDCCKVDLADLKSVAQGLAWLEKLITGRAQSMEEIAQSENVTDRYISKLIERVYGSVSQEPFALDPRLHPPAGT